MSRKMKEKSEEVTFGEMLRLEEELVATKREYGILEEEKKHSLVGRFFERQDARQKQLISKKLYILLTILLGWCGVHRFYSHMWITAVIYLALSWTGLPLAMCVVDLMVVIPMKPDENGKIWM